MVVGTATVDHPIAWRVLAALVVALSLQVAVNYANDLFDALKGVDTPARRGPRRLVSSAVVAPRAMKIAIALCLTVAGIAGAALALAVGPALLLVGIACFVAALAYSGGPRPYASAGLGEVFVFIFFGVVATTGSAYVQTEALEMVALAASVPVGLLAVVILAVNNLRDITTDRAAGKATVAVRLGERRARLLVGALIASAGASVVLVALVARHPAPLLALAAAPAALRPLSLIGSRDEGALLAALGATARLELLAGVLLAAGLWLAR